MPCYSFFNEDFGEHALKTYECMSNDTRIDAAIKKLVIINGWQDYEKLIRGAVLIAGLLHDIGKGITYYQRGTLCRFRCHDFVGSTIMYFITQSIKNLGLPNDVMVFIWKVLMGLPLLHHYLHRDWLTYKECDEIEKIEKIQLSEDCTVAIREILDKVMDRERDAMQLINALNKSLANIGIISKYDMVFTQVLYNAFNDVPSSDKHGNYPDLKILSDTEFTKKYKWFFEVATAVLNECDNKAAEGRSRC